MAGALVLKKPTLLGFPDEDIGEDHEIDFSVSKIGGTPVSTKIQDFIIKIALDTYVTW